MFIELLFVAIAVLLFYFFLRIWARPLIWFSDLIVESDLNCAFVIGGAAALPPPYYKPPSKAGA